MSSTIHLTVAIVVAVLVLFVENVRAMPMSWANFDNDTEIPNIVSRRNWGAREPLARVPMKVTPTPYVVIHHGGIARYCYDEKACSAIVRSYQNYHLDVQGWFDIGYSFVVGEDGNIYEGRGWDYVGAHAPGYNSQSIGICVIGDFSDFLPNEESLKAVNALIDYGISLGKVSEDYHILGHRQARDTLCPGDMFYKYVKTHPRWTDKPVPINTTRSATTTAETIF